jgi:hypothetical protein
MRPSPLAVWGAFSFVALVVHALLRSLCPPRQPGRSTPPFPTDLDGAWTLLV